MAKDYAEAIRTAFRLLDLTLQELDDWSCCGATAAHNLDAYLAAALPARNLAIAEKSGFDLIAPCPNCFNRLASSLKIIGEKKIEIPWELRGELAIYEMTRFLGREDIIRRITKNLTLPLTNLKVVCFYGCQTVRPPRITGYTDFENPQTLDRLAAVLGAEVKDWSYKSTCCGAAIGMGRKDIQESLTLRLLDKARQSGAEAIVVSCPLCQANLDITQRRSKAEPLPVLYFAELLRLALEGGERAGRWLKNHFADPRPLLARKGFCRH